MTAQDREFITNSKAQIQCIDKELCDIYERESRYLSSLLPEEDNTTVAIRVEERLAILDTLFDLLIDLLFGLSLLLEEDEKNES